LLIAGIEFSKTLVKNRLEFLSLGGRQLSWLHAGICGLGETKLFLKKYFKDQIIQLMSSKISLGPLKKFLKIICRKILIIRKLCILAGKDRWMVGWNLIVMEHAKVMVSLPVVAGTSKNLMAGGSRVLAAKLELVMLYMMISHLIVESDSNVLIDMVTNNCKINGTIHSLVQRIQEILRRE